MEIITTVEKEINELNQRGLLRWYCELAAESILFDYIDLYYEAMMTNTKGSKLHLFEYNGKHFFYLIHYDECGEQEFLQSLWDSQRRIVDIAQDL